MRREVRVRERPDRYDGMARKWITSEQPVVKVESEAWIMVRNADYPSAAPFVISRKEWDKLPIKEQHP